MLQMWCAALVLRSQMQGRRQFAGTPAVVLRGAEGPHARRLPILERGEAAGGAAPLRQVHPRPQEVPGSRLGHRFHGRREHTQWSTLGLPTPTQSAKSSVPRSGDESFPAVGIIKLLFLLETMRPNLTISGFKMHDQDLDGEPVLKMFDNSSRKY